MFPAFRVVFFLNHPSHRCHLSQRPPSGISPVSFHFQCPAGMHLCPNLFLVSSVFSSSIHFFQVQTRLSNVSYNGDLLWGVLRFPPIFSLILLFLSNFALQWLFLFSSIHLLCWMNFFPPSIPPPCSEELLTMKFTVLILWLIFCHSGQVLARFCFCHLD